jgi:anti-sigma factor RsiW
VTCADIHDTLDRLLTGRVSPAERAAVTEHLERCDACRGVAADVRAIQEAARQLDGGGAPDRVWTRLANRLELDPEFQRARAADAAARRGRSATLPWRWVATAALLVLVISASLLVMRRSLDGPAAPPTGAEAGNVTPSTLVEAVEVELDKAAQHYENAIAGLEQIADASDSPIDPVLMATLRENLQVIDQAIDDSRQALRSEPDSRIAQESLFDAFRRKVALLQDTIALMNEMRKGNQAGAAAIASGFNKG